MKATHRPQNSRYPKKLAADAMKKWMQWSRRHAKASRCWRLSVHHVHLHAAGWNSKPTSDCLAVWPAPLERSWFALPGPQGALHLLNAIWSYSLHLFLLRGSRKLSIHMVVAISGFVDCGMAHLCALGLSPGACCRVVQMAGYALVRSTFQVVTSGSRAEGALDDGGRLGRSSCVHRACRLVDASLLSEIQI